MNRRGFAVAAVLILALLVAWPALGHLVWFTRYVGESGGTSFTFHDWYDEISQVCGGTYTNNMNVRWGSVTGSTMYFHHHTVRISNLTGRVFGGSAWLWNADGTYSRNNLDLFWTGELVPGSTYQVTWSDNVPWGPQAIIIVDQYTYPGGPASDDSFCSNLDEVAYQLNQSRGAVAGNQPAVEVHTSRSSPDGPAGFHRLACLEDARHYWPGETLTPSWIPSDLRLRAVSVAERAGRLIACYGAERGMVEVIQTQWPTVWEDAVPVAEVAPGVIVRRAENLRGDVLWVVQRQVRGTYLAVASSLGLDETLRIARNCD